MYGTDCFCSGLLPVSGTLREAGLDYTIGGDFNSTTYVIGLYKQWNRTWEITGLAGGGSATQYSLAVGYRFQVAGAGV